MIKLLTSLVVVLATSGSIQAQMSSSPHEVPKLVIGITIDQLRGDYLYLFKQYFSEKGFKRLMNQGLVYDNMTFDFPNLDEASSIATIYTGSNPFYHGIVGKTVYSPKDKSELIAYASDDYLGNYTQEKVSPLALSASTITDELKSASHQLSDVYSLAPQASQALATAGHRANGAFWIDNYSGKWCSSTFYKEFYWVVDQENKSNISYSSQILGKLWTPLPIIKKNNTFTYSSSSFNFQHSLGVDMGETYKLFKKSPFVNEEICNMARKIIAKADLGKRISPDFLALTFYAGNFPGVMDYSTEMLDTYIRLDKDLESLLDAVDKSVGIENTLIFLTSTGYYDSNEELDTIVNKGSFHSNRCEALLNMYLMAIYGNDNWVDKYYNNHIFLNRKLIEYKKLSLKEVQEKAAEFISEFTGVQDVYTSYQLIHGAWNSTMEYYKNGYTKETIGDIFIKLKPGFRIVNEQDKSFIPKIVRNNATVSPVIFFGNNIKPERIKRTIKATEIAPSVSHVLRIRPPNASTALPLQELL